MVSIFLTPFLYCAVYITDKLCTKNGNSSFFKPKIHGLYTRVVTDQEPVIVGRVRYMDIVFHKRLNFQKICHPIVYEEPDSLSESQTHLFYCFHALTIGL